MENVYLAVGVPTVNYGHKDRKVLDLIGTILAGGMSSRLRQKIMDRGLTYSVEYNTEYLSEDGYLMIILTTDRRKLRTVLEIIFGEFKNLAKNSIASEELTIAQGFLSGTLQVNMETTYDWAKWYADQLIYSPVDLRNPEQEVKEILSINAKQIQKAALRYLQAKNIYLSIIGDVRKKDIESLLEEL